MIWDAYGGVTAVSHPTNCFLLEKEHLNKISLVGGLILTAAKWRVHAVNWAMDRESSIVIQLMIVQIQAFIQS